METYIIEKNSLLKTKAFNYWLITFIMALIIIIPRIVFSNRKPIQFDKSFTYIVGFYFISGMIILLINIFKIKKVGFFKFDKQNISIKKNELKRVIKLETIKKLSIYRIQGNIYHLKIENIRLNIVLGKTELIELKNTCKELNINLQFERFLDRLLGLLKT
ncbi:hypothetical protein [Aureibaculum luteum]|uniref:hypothetical protein n=1 Tax=Aureibaculum luteum TaxID=1548456 RepID=UPI000E510C38|nr:hypothetical protein [Aureibaculum luteum]